MSALSFRGADTSDRPANGLYDSAGANVSRWVRAIVDTPGDCLLGHALGRDADADQALWALSRAMQAEGLRIEGFVQLRGAALGDCNCREMQLVDLGNDTRSRISEDRGTGARGCHLDWTALTEVAAQLERRVTPDTDMVIINRFGRAEAEGGGMRSVISAALAQGARVLVGYRPDYAEAWTAFHAGMARDFSV